MLELKLGDCPSTNTLSNLGEMQTLQQINEVSYLSPEPVSEY